MEFSVVATATKKEPKTNIKAITIKEKFLIQFLKTNQNNNLKELIFITI